MDALYVYKHSVNDDFEIRYSLRSVEQYVPYIRKVWIYGDRPAFISEDTSVIEHVPHEVISRALGVKTPVTNFFLLMFLSSLIPDLSSEYLFFSDDFYLLKDYPLEDARKDRYSEDLSKTTRGKGLWIDALWRTYDALVRLGYPGYNFETHTPMYMTRKRIMDAYCDFKDFVTEDRWYGFLGPTAVLNHACNQEKKTPINIFQENTRFGFWGKPPAYEEVIKQSEGKTFFNFDDLAFDDNIRRFLTERFPRKSRYEK